MSGGYVTLDVDDVKKVIAAAFVGIFAAEPSAGIAAAVRRVARTVDRHDTPGDETVGPMERAANAALASTGGGYV